MATNRIKFKMSIEKLNFEFEGDYEQGKAMQQGISSAISGLSNLQNRVLGAEETRKQIESRPVETQPIRRRRKGRKASGGETGGDPAAEGSGNESANGEGGDVENAPRRSPAVQPTKLLIDLRKTGFFSEKRGLSQILDELHRKGFSSVHNGNVTGPLMKLAQKDVLRREQNGDGNWVYEAGTYEEPVKATKAK